MDDDGRATDHPAMPSVTTPQPMKPAPIEPRSPRDRLEQILGRDFTEFLLDALADRPQGRRTSSAP
jgi:hypothetical protein